MIVENEILNITNALKNAIDSFTQGPDHYKDAYDQFVKTRAACEALAQLFPEAGQKTPDAKRRCQLYEAGINFLLATSDTDRENFAKVLLAHKESEDGRELRNHISDIELMKMNKALVAAIDVFAKGEGEYLVAKGDFEKIHAYGKTLTSYFPESGANFLVVIRRCEAYEAGIDFILPKTETDRANSAKVLLEFEGTEESRLIRKTIHEMELINARKAFKGSVDSFTQGKDKYKEAYNKFVQTRTDCQVTLNLFRDASQVSEVARRCEIFEAGISFLMAESRAERIKWAKLLRKYPETSKNGQIADYANEEADINLFLGPASNRLVQDLNKLSNFD